MVVAPLSPVHHDEPLPPKSPLEQIVAPVHPMVTRGKDGIRKPNPRYALMTVKTAYPEPKYVVAALKDPYWNASMGKVNG